MSNLLTAIRAAVSPVAAPHALVNDGEGQPDASASIPEINPTGGTMAANQTLASAAPAATIAAVAAAATGGGDGFKTAMDRMNAVLGADGIKGDAKRMSAALDLANASLDMAAEAVVAFVTSNVPASPAASLAPAAAGPSAATTTPPDAAAAYEKQRVAAASLAMPGGGNPSAGASINRDAIFAARRATPKGA